MQCSKCYLQINNSNNKGIMTYEQAKVIYDETAFKGVTFAPHIWSEPLLVHDLDKHIETIKSGQNHISINSNGLLLNKDKAKNDIRSRCR